MSVQYDKNFDEIKKLIEEGLVKSLEEIGEDISNEAKSRAPVDTGELQESIGYLVDNDELIIGAEAEHSVMVELGTSNMEAQPFLRDSVMDSLANIEKTVAKNMPTSR